MILYPHATYKPVRGMDSDPRLDVVEGVIWHIAATEAESLYGYFNGPSGGIESHLYIPRGPEHDIEQYRPLDHEADANYRGNSWLPGDGKRHGFLSIEFQGADPNTGLWTPWQVEQGLAFTEFALRTFGFPRRVCPNYRAGGIGYHTMWGSGRGTNSWSSAAGKTCPGSRRIGQFNNEVLPRFLAGGAVVPPVVRPKPDGPKVPTLKAPPFPLPKGWYFGPRTGPRESVSGYFSYRGYLALWQRRMSVRGWRLRTDGLWDSRCTDVARMFQKQCRLSQDGKVGPMTWAAAWTQAVT